MSAQDPQAAWSEYFARKKAERLAEAGAMLGRMRGEGVGEDAALALDFEHFGDSLDAVEALAAQLGENYAVEVVAGPPGYWHAKGTTRPYGVDLPGSRLRDWVEFMADVAQSHSCVFSRWIVEAPALGKRFDSEAFSR